MKNLHICLWMAGNANWMGGAIYTQNIARAIASLPIEERANIKISVACLSSHLNLVQPIVKYVDKVYTYGKPIIKISHTLADRLVFLPPEIFNPLNIDFLYSTYAGKKAPYAWGGWIADFQHHYYPEFFSQKQLHRRSLINKKIADNAPVVVLSSKMAESDFHRFYPNAAPKTRVMNFISYLEPEYFQLNPQETKEKYQLPDNFFLVSNQFWPHKNHNLIVEALGILKKRNIFPTIICTGSFNSDSEHCSKLLTRIRELGLENQFKILGLIPRIDQIQMMRQCLAVIQPSLFEGWSTVIEDARALGKPILASNFPVHLEQNPPNTLFFGQNDPEQLASLISEGLFQFNQGLDVNAEEKAKYKNQQQTLNYGRSFLEIVKQTINNQKQENIKITTYA